MDAINRNISVNMMIRAAERSIGKQFILITPQTMNNQNTTNQVKIIKYSPLLSPLTISGADPVESIGCAIQNVTTRVKPVLMVDKTLP